MVRLKTLAGDTQRRWAAGWRHSRDHGHPIFMRTLLSIIRAKHLRLALYDKR